MAKNNLSAEEQSKIIQHVTNFKQDILQATENLRNVWLELYKNYRLFKAQDKKAWQSKLWIPKTFTAIEQIASRTTAHNPKFNLKALQSSALQFYTANQAEIDETIATNKEAEINPEVVPKEMPEPKVMSSRDILEAYLLYVFTEQKLKQKIRLWDKGRLIYGTYHVKISTDVLTETRKSKKKKDDGSYEEVEEEIFKNVLPDINVVDVFDFLIHPFERSVDEAYGVIHKRDDVSLNELDDETYFNLDLISSERSSGLDLEPEELEKRNIIATNVQKKIKKDSFCLNEYWGKYSKTGKPEDEKEYIITVVDDALVIRCEENELKDPNGKPVRPFVAMHDQPVPGEYYAIGDAEPIMSLQKEMNDLRNLRQDYNNQALYPEWMVRKGSGINPFQLVHKPNNIILVDDMQSLEPVPKDLVPQSGYREEESLNQDIQETTSTTNFASPGATSAFTDTATGAAIRQEEQNTRMKLKVEYLDDAVSELGRKILLIVGHELEDNIEIPDEDNFHTVYKDAFKKMAEGFSPQVVSGSMAADTPSERRNEAIARGNIALQYAQAGVPVNLEAEYKNIMSEGFKVGDTDSLLKEAPPQGTPEGGAPLMEAPAPEQPNPELDGPPKI